MKCDICMVQKINFMTCGCSLNLCTDCFTKLVNKKCPQCAAKMGYSIWYNIYIYRFCMICLLSLINIPWFIFWILISIIVKFILIVFGILTCFGTPYKKLSDFLSGGCSDAHFSFCFDKHENSLLNKAKFYVYDQMELLSK